MAETNGLRVAYSNQAFELWFLLHYGIIQGPMHRSLYTKRLSKLIGYDYKKEGGFASRLYWDLLPLQPQAIRNARQLMTQMKGISPAQAESSTTVYQLVEELNKFID